MDWKRFLQQHRVQFVEGGPNWAPGNVNVHCPWCGAADPSEHLCISTRGHGYVCRRNRAHGGKSPVRLITALLRCSTEEAIRLLQGDDAPPAATDAEMLATVGARLGAATKPRLATRLPRAFKPLLTGVFSRSFEEYLIEERDYRKAQLPWLASTYELHYAIRGPYAWRLIMPIRDRWGKLLSWTARSVLPEVEPRYKALKTFKDGRDPDDTDGPGWAAVSISDTVLSQRLLWECENPEVLVIVEGPLDAVRITTFGHSLGVYATCLFGLGVTDAQLAVLRPLAERFSSRWLLLDDDAKLQRLRLLQVLEPTLRCQLANVDLDAKDPGALSSKQTMALCQQLLTAPKIALGASASRRKLHIS